MVADQVGHGAPLGMAWLAEVKHIVVLAVAEVRKPAEPLNLFFYMYQVLAGLNRCTKSDARRIYFDAVAKNRRNKIGCALFPLDLSLVKALLHNFVLLARVRNAVLMSCGLCLLPSPLNKFPLFQRVLALEVVIHQSVAHLHCWRSRHFLRPQCFLLAKWQWRCRGFDGQTKRMHSDFLKINTSL